MKAGNLQITMAEAMLAPPSIVKVTMRKIREGGKLTTGAHGVNAPDMTYLDAARVLCALLVEDSPGRRSAAHVDEFGSLPWANPGYPYESHEFTLQAILPDVGISTFETAIAALIRVFTEGREHPAFTSASRTMMDGSVQLPECRIEIFPRDRVARVVMDGAYYDFAVLRSIRDAALDDDERFRMGRQAVCFVNQQVIAHLAEGFAS